MVELHGLVGAYKLNGQLAECIEFDVEMQRYVVLLKSGESKKVKPQNVKPLGILRSEMINILQLKAIMEEKRRQAFRSDIIQLMKKWNCVIPNVVSSRVLVDWSKLENPDLRKRLLESKRVSLETLPNDVSVVFLSIPRETLCLGEGIEDQPVERIEMVKNTVREFGPLLEKNVLKSQVYWILPFGILDSLELPMIKRAFYCSYPLFQFLVDQLVLCLDKKDDPMSLRFAAQRLDLVCAAKAGVEVTAVSKEKVRELKLSLPSRGDCGKDEVKILREIETSLNIQRPVDGDKSFIVKCHHSS